MSNYSAEATGGCGAGLQVKIEIIREGTYDIVVGSGGSSIYGASTHTGGDGRSSTLSYNGNTILFCGGGSGGTTSLVKATPGTGGPAIMSPRDATHIIHEYTPTL